MQSNQLTPFAFGENLVRVIEDEHGEPWFVAKDVCNVLSLCNITEALRNLDEDERGSEIMNTPGGDQEMLIISESGLYALVFRSRKPEARAFSKWVRAEVLPAIRKTGRYEVPGRKIPRNISLLEELPPEALALKAPLRQRLWRDALDTARLDGGDIDLAIYWFGRLCRMMACDCVWENSKSSAVHEFFRACCVASPGSRLKASVLYEAMRHWMRGKNMEMPSMKVFGESMRWLAPSFRSNGIYYTGICLK